MMTINKPAKKTNINKRSVWRWLRWPVYFLLSLLLVLVVALCGLLWWSAQPNSLPKALTLAQKYLPQDQTLLFDGAQGSVSRGGSIEHLQWQGAGVEVALDQLTLDWHLFRVFKRQLQVDALHAQSVKVTLHEQESKPEEPPEKPFQMPQDVVLPLHIQIPLQLDALEIETVAQDGIAATYKLENIALDYTYDGLEHAVALQNIAYAQSAMQARATLNARTLALQGNLLAYLDGIVPDSHSRIAVPLHLAGSLADGDSAKVMAQLDAIELPTDFSVPSGSNALLSSEFTERLARIPEWKRVAATVEARPWRQQPLQMLDIRLSNVDAHTFAEQAPTTLLNGTLELTPVENVSVAQSSNSTHADTPAQQQWLLGIDLKNDKAGLLDDSLLPLTDIDANGVLNESQLKLETLRLQLGASGQASVDISGHVDFEHQDNSLVDIRLQDIDLRNMLSTLPQTMLSGGVSVKPAKETTDAPLTLTEKKTFLQSSWTALLDVSNAAMGAWDAEKLPFNRVQVDASISPQLWQLNSAVVNIAQGAAKVTGHYRLDTQEMQLEGELNHLPMRQLLQAFEEENAPDLTGSFHAAGNLKTKVGFSADIAGERMRAQTRDKWAIHAIKASGDWSPELLNLAFLDVDGLNAKIEAKNFALALPAPSSVDGVLSMSAPGLSLAADVSMQKNAGQGSLALNIESAQALVQWLQQLPVLGDQLPPISASGQAALKASWQGGFEEWLHAFKAPQDSPNLNANLLVDTQALKLKISPNAADQLEGVQVAVNQFHLDAQGNLRQAVMNVEGDVLVDGIRGQLQSHMQMRQLTGGQAGWSLAIEKLLASVTFPEDAQPWRLAMNPDVSLNIYPSASATRVTLSEGGASLMPPEQVAPAKDALKLYWDASSYEKLSNGASRILSKGGIGGLHLGWIDDLVPSGATPLADAGINTNLVFAGQWDVNIGNTVNVQASLKRTSGDIRFGQSSTKVQSGDVDHAQIFGANVRSMQAIGAGVKDISLQINSKGSELSAQLLWDTERAGKVAAQVQTSLVKRGQGWSLEKTSPLAGRVTAGFPDLKVLGFLAPPGWRISGALNADLTVAGTVASPELNGSIMGEKLNARSILDGVDLHNGHLKAQLGGHRLTINELYIEGGTGSTAYVPGVSGNKTVPPTDRGSLLLANGYIDWSKLAAAQAPDQSDAGLDMDLKIQLERMQVLSRNDRQITVSGSLGAMMQDGALDLQGDIHVDRASITLPEAGAPALGDDVVVIRKSDPPQDSEVTAILQTAKPMDMNIKLDLGQDFALQGYGITTRLNGNLTITSTQTGNPPIRIVGEIHTDEGRYRAWGQALNVETGTILFNGPYDNPSINILAIRPNIDVVAGVRVTGTASAPRIQLYSEPVLPDSEILSWVVLGRSAAASGSEGGAMQQAALGLVAGEVGKGLAGGLGLDEVGFSGEGLSVGKRLSDQLYVTYMASMTGAGGTLYILYDITRRLTARAETGEQSAVDMIYTMTFD